MPFYDESDDVTNFVATFRDDPKSDFGVFAKGYKLAADRLAESLISAPSFACYEAYPIVFLYRHALELSLKHILYSAARLSAFRFSNTVDEKLQNGHHLPTFVKNAEQILNRLFPNETELGSLMKLVSKTCDDWNNLDPGSYAYRYPITTTGQRSTRRNQIVNLGDLASKMSDILRSLEVVHLGLDVKTDLETDKAKAIYELLHQIEEES